MIKLYLKTLVAGVLLIFLIISGYHFGFYYFTNQNYNSINQLISKGTFSYIQTALSRTPQSEWASTLNKLQPSDEALANIKPIKSLALNNQEKKQLQNGKIIFPSAYNFHFSYFLFYGTFEIHALQRIGNSQFALEIMISESINQTIRDTMRWMVHIISRELKRTPKEQWPLVLEKLQITFGMPLKLIPNSSDIITNKMRTDLNTYAVAFLKPKTGKPISTLYFHTPDPKKILVIGPIKYSPLSKLFSVAQHYYFMSFAVASIIFVLFLTWLFSRNIIKIYQITKRYSKGNFSHQISVSSFSILHGVYQNVVSMGNHLKRLIQSQQNMTRFVAHEVRTPLSTMQLAVDSLKKESGLSESSRQKIESIQEDIGSINQLISYFLLYYKTTAHELKLKTQLLNMRDWLESVVNKYKFSKTAVTLSLPNKDNLMINFDPNLLKHAVDNLITNALKFAKSAINIRLEIDDSTILIHVDDDGTGIPASEIKNIFEPFATLDDSNTLGKHIGLGLSIAKSIVELHGGSLIATQSEQLGGARFTIKLKRYMHSHL